MDQQSIVRIPLYTEIEQPQAAIERRLGPLARLGVSWRSGAVAAEALEDIRTGTARAAREAALFKLALLTENYKRTELVAAERARAELLEHEQEARQVITTRVLENFGDASITISESEARASDRIHAAHAAGRLGEDAARGLLTNLTALHRLAADTELQAATSVLENMAEFARRAAKLLEAGDR